MSKSLDELNHFRFLLTGGEGSAEDTMNWPYFRFSPEGAWRPDLNIYETADSLVVCVDMAGMEPHSYSVSVEDDYLVLRGERSQPMPRNAGGNLGVLLMEIDAGVFCRRMALACPVEAQPIDVEYREGLLWITVRKLG